MEDLARQRRVDQLDAAAVDHLLIVDDDGDCPSRVMREAGGPHGMSTTRPTACAALDVRVRGGRFGERERAVDDHLQPAAGDIVDVPGDHVAHALGGDLGAEEHTA